MAFSSLGSLESIMTKKHPGYIGVGHPEPGNYLQSIKSQYEIEDDDEDMEEPTSVLDYQQCISPPLQHDEWISQQQQEAAKLSAFEKQVEQLQIDFHQQQVNFENWQLNNVNWEAQLWEKQQAEIAEQYSQIAARQNFCPTVDNAYFADPQHALQPSWDVAYDPYQNSVGLGDTIMQSIPADPWVDFQQQEIVYGSQLMQGLPPLEDPLLLENWMTSYSGDSSLTSVSTEVDSSPSQSFLIPDEQESLSNSPSQQQQHGNRMSRCPSAASVGPVHEVSELVDIPMDDQYDMQLAMDNFNTTTDPLEDIKPTPNWFLQGAQDTIGSPQIQQFSPSPMSSPPSYQHKQPFMNRNQGLSKFQMPMSTPDHSIIHQMTNKGNFISAQPAATADIKPASRTFEAPTPVNSRTKSMTAPAATVEAVNKPGARLWGPVRPTSHSLGAAVETLYPRPASESNMSRRRSENSANQKQDGNGHTGGLMGGKNGSNDHNTASRGHNTSGAGRVVTLAELASGGVKMGGVQLPTVGTQIPSNVRLAVETQASGMGGVRMVQVLLACAEAVACRDSRQANILLQQLQHMASPYGDAMQRITACFVEGLSARLANTGSQPFKFTNLPRKPPSDDEKREGFNLVYQSSPYVAFGHFAANTAILEAFEGEDRMHIVDLGMTHSLQWPYLIHGLAKRPSGPPKLLRITGFGLSPESMTEAGEELSRVAAEVNVPFEFRAVKGPLEELQKSKLELREGEALAVNSVLQLHCVVKESRGSLNSVLQSIHELSPKILTLVEQDASHNGPFFLGRFMEALHYYSAIFDSLDAILPRSNDQRVKMEQFHFAEEIKNIVSCEGPARVERHERVDQWRRRMSRAGFQPLPLKFLSQARLWLGLYSCEGYTLSEEKGCLVLGWKGKPIIAASSWKR